MAGSGRFMPRPRKPAPPFRRFNSAARPRRQFSGLLMIDLNTASAAELDTVPQLKGHGFEITRYREERGRFDALRQLEEVPGLAGKWDGAEAFVAVS